METCQKVAELAAVPNPLYWIGQFLARGRAGWREYVQRNWRGNKLVVLLGGSEPLHFLQGQHEVPPESCGLIINLADYMVQPFGSDLYAGLDNLWIEVLPNDQPLVDQLELCPTRLMSGSSTIRVRMIPRDGHHPDITTLGEICTVVRRVNELQHAIAEA